MNKKVFFVTSSTTKIQKQNNKAKQNKTKRLHDFNKAITNI